MSSEDDSARLRRAALEVVVDMPRDYAEAIIVLNLVMELVEWRESGKRQGPDLRVVSFPSSDDSPAA